MTMGKIHQIDIYQQEFYLADVRFRIIWLSAKDMSNKTDLLLDA